MQRTHACIFARFTRKMHGNDNILKSGCFGILRMLGESFAFAPRNESFAFGEGDHCTSMSGSKYMSGSKTMSLEIATSLRSLADKLIYDG